MDDLQKLLENAGMINEGGQLQDTEDALNRLSRAYTFALNSDAKIRVYMQGGHQKEFSNFDDMLENFGNT